MNVTSLFSTFKKWAGVLLSDAPTERKHEPSPSDRMIDRLDKNSAGNTRHSEVLRNGNVTLTVWGADGTISQLVKNDGVIKCGHIDIAGNITPLQISDFDIPEDLKSYCIEGNISGPATPVQSNVDRPHCAM